MRPRDLHLGSSHCTSKLPLLLHQAGHPGTVQAGTNSRQSLTNSFSTIALHMPLNPVNDWVADFGASHHTTPSVGNIFKFVL
jgi:hypothetical protein